MTIFFTSDVHFGHGNLLHKYQPNRKELGDSVQAMNDEIVRRWNAVVTPNDQVFNLGDFAFYRDPEQIVDLLKRLNGIHHFVFGNHDQTIQKNRHIFTKYFFTMRDYVELRHEGEFIVMSHFPLAIWNKMHHGAIHVHGHCHGSYVEPHGNRIVDVGIDSPHVTGKYEMRPFSFEEIREHMKQKSFKPLDGHYGKNE